jgi:hypothetical protein
LIFNSVKNGIDPLGNNGIQQQQRNLCDDVESPWKLIGFARSQQRQGILYFFHPTFNLNPMTW